MSLIQPIIGISTPLGDKLYTGSKDGTVRVWDCHSGECDRVINLGAEVGSLISEGHWVFAGLPNVVKVNFQSWLCVLFSSLSFSIPYV